MDLVLVTNRAAASRCGGPPLALKLLRAPSRAPREAFLPAAIAPRAASSPTPLQTSVPARSSGKSSFSTWMRGARISNKRSVAPGTRTVGLKRSVV
ncbi:hypothetical protein PLICRDRAFT_480363 [Plicaturopsis crispa FD-325 SS-3]|nr:hypothetical protein PLICRDRAFT_480363 [Plicaturopsis crispa FD-325 SS-3]